MRAVLDRLNQLLTRSSDLVLAGGVVLVLAALVIRIPPPAIDFLIATNISLAAVVLLISLYIANAVKFPSFPTVLLLMTLFRLALNVSTTRLILLEADAGQIIFAFGNFVVAGNFVVGGVVFLVLVIVQFIVIAKGSERVAEVSARFTLDAMPGKQMSIDADLRAGLINADQARARRETLERESRLFGAMDGAMKFVKGDAIAGIIISLINIIGGLIVGVTQMGMSAGEATQTYALLTIGDGLVSQIPALVLSVAAGLVVTRVAAGESGSPRPVATDIFEQLINHPRALWVVSALLILLSATSGVTGFPWLPFAAMSGVCAVLALIGMSVAARREQAHSTTTPNADEEQAREPAERPDRFRPMPLLLDIHASLRPLFYDNIEELTLKKRAEQARTQIPERVAMELGLPIPAIRFRVGNARIAADCYSLLIDETPVEHGSMSPDRCIAMCTPEAAAEAGVQAVAASLPWLPKLRVCQVSLADAEVLQQREIAVLRPDVVVMTHVRHALERRAEEFLGVQEAARLLELIKNQSADLYKSVVPSLLTVQQVSEVLRRLLREGVPIRDMRRIMASLARNVPLLMRRAAAIQAEQMRQREAGQPGGPPPHVDSMLIAEEVRLDLARTISARLSEDGRTVRFYGVDPQIEQLVESAITMGADGSLVVALSFGDQQQVVRSIEASIDFRRHMNVPPVLVTRRELRRVLRTVIQEKLPQVAVLSFDEMSAEFEYRQIGMVRMLSTLTPTA